MAVTAHYCVYDESGNLVVRSHLIAFRHVVGSHSGANLAFHFMTILRELNILHRVRPISIILDLCSLTSTAWHDHSRQCIQL
jgi:hypothetical protein